MILITVVVFSYLQRHQCLVLKVFILSSSTPSTSTLLSSTARYVYLVRNSQRTASVFIAFISEKLSRKIELLIESLFFTNFLRIYVYVLCILHSSYLPFQYTMTLRFRFLWKKNHIEMSNIIRIVKGIL